MKNRGRLLIVAGLLIALLAGVGVFLLGSARQQQANVQLVNVVVATKPFSRFDRVTKDQAPALLVLDKRDAKTVPPSAFHSLAEMFGEKTSITFVQPVVLGEVLVSERVSSATANGLAVDPRIKEDQVAWSIASNEVGVVAGGIQADSHIDIMVSVRVSELQAPTAPAQPGQPAAAPSGNNQTLTTWLLATDVLVLNTGSNYVAPAAPVAGAAPAPAAAPPPQVGPTTITLALTREQALALKFFLDKGSTVQFLLRPANSPAVTPDTPTWDDPSVINDLVGKRMNNSTK